MARKCSYQNSRVGARGTSCANPSRTVSNFSIVHRTHEITLPDEPAGSVLSMLLCILSRTLVLWPSDAEGLAYPRFIVGQNLPPQVLSQSHDSCSVSVAGPYTEMYLTGCPMRSRYARESASRLYPPRFGTSARMRAASETSAQNDA